MWQFKRVAPFVCLAGRRTRVYRWPAERPAERVYRTLRSAAERVACICCRVVAAAGGRPGGVAETCGLRHLLHQLRLSRAPTLRTSARSFHLWRRSCVFVVKNIRFFATNTAAAVEKKLFSLKQRCRCQTWSRRACGTRHEVTAARKSAFCHWRCSLIKAIAAATLRWQRPQLRRSAPHRCSGRGGR